MKIGFVVAVKSTGEEEGEVEEDEEEREGEEGEEGKEGREKKWNEEVVKDGGR